MKTVGTGCKLALIPTFIWSLWYMTKRNGFLFVLFALLWEGADLLAQVGLTMGPVGPLTWWHFSLVPKCITEIATTGN